MEPRKTRITAASISAQMNQVARQFRRCLFKLGIPKCSIREVSERVPTMAEGPERRYCEKLNDAYCKLTEMEKMVCVRDLFERESNYRFWYYGAICEKRHTQYVRDVSLKMCAAVGVSF